jgi:phospholipid/cholesterol/gamma-HCH transport system substrate-binding protein
MNTSKNIKLGLFLILSLVFVLLALYFIGSKRNLFSSNFTLKARFHNVSGLQPGNNVRLMGIDVGTVKSVNILNDTTVEVIMIVENNVKEFIKEDASASVGTEGLMGSKLVNISVGSPGAKVVENGSTIQTVKPVSTDDILRTVDYTSQYTAILSSELVKTIGQINTGKGTLGSLINNPQMATDLEETIAGLNKSSKETALFIHDLRNTANAIQSGKGVIGTAMHDTAISNDLRVTLDNLARSSRTLSKSLDNLQELSKRANNETGVLAMLTEDTAIANDLKNTLQSAREGAEGFNQNMEALKHNFLLRRYFRKQEKQ